MGNSARGGPHPPSSTVRPQRILVRGVNWLGDAVMATPALMRLRQAQSQAKITLLTLEKLTGLWTHHPSVDETFSFTPEDGVLSIGNRLRGARFDAALILPNSPRSALEAWLARIPRRIGYARPWRNWFLTQAVPPRPGRVEMHKRSPREIRQLVAASAADFPITQRQSPSANPQTHQLHEYLHLVAALGADPEPVQPFLCVTQEEVKTVRRQFDLGEDRRWIGMVPGAEYGPAKRWPKENFIAAARTLQQRPHCGVVLFGGSADAALAAEIESALGAPPGALRNLTDQTTLRQLCAGLKLCAVALTNDTGPMHVAAAVGTPVVVPFGSTSPELTGPGMPGEPRHRLLQSAAPCAPCFRRQCPIDFRCMKGIGPSQVIEAVLDILRQPV
jgi:heptosyltransferase-2